MNKGLVLLSGIGMGAGLMYVLDPDRGERRRALMRDTVARAKNKAGDYAGKVSRDLRNRAQGLAAETAAIFNDGEIRDEVLVERVRAAMGQVPVHHGALKVAATKGIVTLSGEALANELPALMAAIRSVRGVNDVISELNVHGESDETPGLQGSLRQVAV
jgi:osmotically-inducible protein OsmY